MQSWLLSPSSFSLKVMASFLIQGVGYFSKYERKQPVTALAQHLSLTRPAIATKGEAAFTSWRETKWLCFLAVWDLARGPHSVHQDRRAECLLCAQPLPCGPGPECRPPSGGHFHLGSRTGPGLLKGAALPPFLASSLAFPSPWGPIQAETLART